MVTCKFTRFFSCGLTDNGFDLVSISAEYYFDGFINETAPSLKTEIIILGADAKFKF